MKYYIKSTDIKSTLRVLFLCLMAATNGQENTKLFSLISPEHSGVTFNNTLKDNKTENILLYSNFYLVLEYQIKSNQILFSFAEKWH